jgi:hypothetical protein
MIFPQQNHQRNKLFKKNEHQKIPVQNLIEKLQKQRQNWYFQYTYNRGEGWDPIVRSYGPFYSEMIINKKSNDNKLFYDFPTTKSPEK